MKNRQIKDKKSNVIALSYIKRSVRWSGTTGTVLLITPDTKFLMPRWGDKWSWSDCQVLRLSHTQSYTDFPHKSHQCRQQIDVSKKSRTFSWNYVLILYLVQNTWSSSAARWHSCLESTLSRFRILAGWEKTGPWISNRGNAPVTELTECDRPRLVTLLICRTGDICVFSKPISDELLSVGC